MPTLIEIEGGIARLVSRTVEYEVPTEALAKHLIKPQATLSPLLPVGTVAYRGDPANNHYSLLVERKPRPELITLDAPYYGKENWYNDLGLVYDADLDNDPWVDSLTLPVPWEYYLFSGEISPRPVAGADNVFIITESYLYWSPIPLVRWDQTLYPARLPNINSAGSICWGDTDSTNDSLAAKINDRINTFYTSGFNDHWGHMRMPASIPELLAGIPKDIFGCPQYDWNAWSPTTLDWDVDYAQQGEPHGLVNIQPPHAWNMTDVTYWLERLTPARRNTLARLIEQMPNA